MKKIIIACIAFSFFACTPQQIQQATDILNQGTGTGLTNIDIGNGLKEALNNGIAAGASRLSATDGFYKSSYKILLPEEARKVTDKLKAIPGFDKVEDEIVKKINRSAEDAASKAKPIFVNAIKNMTFSDAMNILMGDKNAATQYLEKSTRQQLYAEFQPVILTSLNKFGAVNYWQDAVNKYNAIPFVTKMNPRIDDYVAERSLDGLFSMVEKEERAIRKDPLRRTTDLLKKVFAKQD